ncbi:hypothetical protein LWI28_007760 [Acer negundo]|uniref:Uncharacterized protein n=1 Tax=Acer negundo TaxID=4023 RepID=A0AAD5ILV3_ACENE|nr:hypothetical protein LWI28_007760 [Acer negundo]KAK4842476.1 hypothetical protein QYF36_022356 [Acer negundo]
MNSSFLTASSPSFSVTHLNFNNKISSNPSYLPCRKISCNFNHNPITHSLKSFAKTFIFIGATLSISSNFHAKAQPPPPPPPPPPPLATVIETNVEQVVVDDEEEALESLKSVLQHKLENGEDEESLRILQRLVVAQPDVTDWKFLLARLLSEMGKTQDARNVFEEILVGNPLCFEALFENALLMDRCGEGEAVIRRLQEALDIAEEGNNTKEARDVRLIMAQILFLQKNVEEALQSYQQLEKEDPSDFRPYFCKGMIYSLLDRNAEAKEEFAKYRQLSPKKFEVDGYLRTPLSRVKLFGTNEEGNSHPEQVL